MNHNRLLLYLIFYMTIGMSLAAESISYVSQSNQDRILNKYFFQNKRDGVFIDIGAHDGITYSNTYFFEKELGWTGICFEPMPNEFAKLKANRTCTCLNVCVSPIEGIVPFILVTSPAVSIGMLSGMLDTYDPRHFERMKQDIQKYGGSYEIIDVPSVRFDRILKENGIKKIDYLSVDTEGGELNILKLINFDEIEVSAISVENNYQDMELRSFLISQGFVLVAYLHGFDELYIHKNKIHQLAPIPAEELQ